MHCHRFPTIRSNSNLTSSTTAPTVFFFRQVVLHVLQTERKRKQHPLKEIGAIILCLEESIPSLGARQVTFVAATAHSFFFSSVVVYLSGWAIATHLIIFLVINRRLDAIVKGLAITKLGMF